MSIFGAIATTTAKATAATAGMAAKTAGAGVRSWVPRVREEWRGETAKGALSDLAVFAAQWAILPAGVGFLAAFMVLAATATSASSVFTYRVIILPALGFGCCCLVAALGGVVPALIVWGKIINKQLGHVPPAARPEPRPAADECRTYQLSDNPEVDRAKQDAIMQELQRQKDLQAARGVAPKDMQIDLDAAVSAANRINKKTVVIDAAKIKGIIKDKILGQDETIDQVVDSVERAQYYRVHGNDGEPTKPLASFLFLGPTGVGKTELAKALAKCIYGADNPDKAHGYLAFDMGNFADASTAARLFGPPPGYVGMSEGGQLTRPLITGGSRRVILFDEIEKASPTLTNTVFLPLLDEGRISENSTGETAYARDAIIIYTSNLLWDRLQHERLPVDEVRRLLIASGKLSPEMIARINSIVVFSPLTTETAIRIAGRMITRSARRLDIEIVEDATAAADYIARQIMPSVETKQGARNIMGVVDRCFCEELIALHKKGVRRVRLSANGIGRA